MSMVNNIGLEEEEETKEVVEVEEEEIQKLLGSLSSMKIQH